MKKYLSLLLIALLMSCNDSVYSKNIIGEWQCTQWVTVETSKDNCNNNVYFKFNEDKTYASKILSDQVNGMYKIENGLLYCKPNDKMEIAVEINELNNDSLVFTMSRSGNKEILTLIKKK